jgi:limonene 1,2-monooxygenase
MGEHPDRLPRDAYAEDLQEIITADRLGWDEVWIGEHHLNGKQEVLPHPEMLIAQAAIAFERWTGIGGMDDVMREAVAPLLADPTAIA